MAIPEGTITSVRWDLLVDADVRKLAFAVVVSPDQMRGNKPREAGIDDLHMGTTDSHHACATCGLNKQQCLGHSGLIKLNYPVVSPAAKEEVVKWLNIICRECGELVVPRSSYVNAPIHRRFELAYAARTRAQPECPSCGAARYAISLKQKRRYIYTQHGKEQQVLAHEIERTLSRVSRDTVEMLGKPLLDVSALVIHVLTVPPVATRPAVRKVTGARVTNNDITTMLQLIVKKNDALPARMPAQIDSILLKQVDELDTLIHECARGGSTSETTLVSNAASIKSKRGHIRGNLLGKRCARIARSTIIGDKDIPVDAVGVPLHFARTIDVEETVREHNFDRLLQHVRNGKTYPGAVAVVRVGTRVRTDIAYITDGDLSIGDTVCRHITDGDFVIFNRQPTLMISNMSAHRVIVLRDPQSFAIRMNVGACPLYNADFDGDAMNLVFVAQESARAEMAMLSAVKNVFISHSASSPPMGQVDDGVIGMAELTAIGTTLDRYHAMRLFDDASMLPSFADDSYHGRDVISMLLADTPLNYRRNTTSFNDAMVPYITYDPSERTVHIRNGKMLSGIMDKSSIGKGQTGGLYHHIAIEYGPGVALRLMHDMQKIAIAYLGYSGYSVGIGDIVLPQRAYDDIAEVSSGILMRADMLSEDLLNGAIVPSFGETIESMYERQLIELLKTPDDFYRIVMTNINARTNGMFKLILTGSKGNHSQMFNMMVSVGQKLLNNLRLPLKFGIGRVSVNAQRFSLRPQDRGYIVNSLTRGMNSQEFMASAAASRLDLTIKALSTATTGEMNRKSTICLSPIISDNYMRVVRGRIVLELVFGDNAADTRAIEGVTFPTIELDDATMRNEYAHKDYPEFFSAMMRDRDDFRRDQLAMEHLAHKSSFTTNARMIFNLSRIIENVRNSAADTGKFALDASMRVVADAITAVPYAFMNSILERKRAYVLRQFHMAARWPIMAIRSLLNPRTIERDRISEAQLRMIFAKMRLKMVHSFIVPGTPVGIIASQSFSEPFTQYMLDAHHRSAAGGSSFEALVNIKAILEAKQTRAIKNPTMLLRVRAAYEQDEKRVREIANSIEIVTLREFVTRYQVFIEPPFEPMHPQYAHEQALIDAFLQMNPLLTPPSDLINYCIRVVVSKHAIILKDIPLELIIARLRMLYPQYYFLYTPENAPEIILRVYVRGGAVTSASVDVMRGVATALLDTTIRGVSGITGVEVRKCERHGIDASTGALVKRTIYAIRTRGTNIVGVAGHPDIDNRYIISSSIREMAEVYGITAARNQIIVAMREVIDCNWCHLAIYADEMTSTGEVTPIAQKGLDTREHANTLLRAGLSSPYGKFVEAALNRAVTPVGDMISALIVGGAPTVGTNYNEYVVDEELVREHIESPDDVIEDIYS